MKSNLSFLAVSVILAVLPQLLGSGIPLPMKKKVLILGAGVAGITAAKTLYDQGITDFLVLEAQDYIGGRMKQVQFPGTRLKVEEGANWIDFVDDEDNPLNLLRKKYNLTGHFTNDSDFSMRDDFNQDVTDLRIYDWWQSVRDKLFAMGAKRGKQDNAPSDMPASVALNLLKWHSTVPMKKTFSWFDIDYKHGSDEDQTSVNKMRIPGQDFFVSDPRGYWTLFRDFYKPFQDKILLNKFVMWLKYSDNGVTVFTADGTIFSADYALSTFSSAVLGNMDLKRGWINPPFPEWKREAIYRMRPAHHTKIFLQFSRQFWGDHEWILHASEKPGNFPVFYNLNRAGFFPGSDILLAVVTGDEALRVEGQKDSKTMTEVMEALRKMYGPRVPYAKAIHVTKWSRNPFTRAAWTYPSVGTSKRHYNNMAGRLKNLFFAGGSTSFEWSGYAQGAYFTGRDKANEIASCIKGGKCEPYEPAI